MRIKEVYDKLHSFIFHSLYQKHKEDLLFFNDVTVDPDTYDMYYCMMRSGSKNVIIFDEADTLEVAENNLSNISEILYRKYKSKWNNIFQSFEIDKYKVNEDFRSIETYNGEKSNEIKENKIYEGSVRKNTKVVDSGYETNNDDFYGFGAENVGRRTPTNDNTNKNVNITEGLKDDNFTENNSTDVNNTTVSGREGNKSDKTGLNRHTNQEMIEQELMLRSKVFLDMVCDDIDSTICLSVY